MIIVLSLGLLATVSAAMPALRREHAALLKRPSPRLARVRIGPGKDMPGKGRP